MLRQGSVRRANTIPNISGRHVSRLPMLNWADWKIRSPSSRSASFLPTDTSTLVEPFFCDQSSPYAFLTDPEETGSLWELVRATKTMPPRSRLPTSSGSSLRTDETSTSKKTLKATTRDPDFADTQLKTRGISICIPAFEEIDTAVPYPSFGTEPPPDREHVAEHYSKAVESYHGAAVSGEELSMIWVLEERELCHTYAMEYQYFHHATLPEREYESLALQKMLPRTRSIQLHGPIRQAKVVRLLGQGLKPRPTSGWLEPPLFHGQEKPFDYNIFPDCQYYLSSSLFNQDYAGSISKAVAITARHAFLPYFTIEFKRDGKNTTVVQNQLAAAASISLFNRYKLKQRALTTQRKRKNAQDSKDTVTEMDDWRHVRHYGLSMESSWWNIWIIEPVSANGDTWKGCEMKWIGSGDCCTDSGVWDLAQWVNEIHLWAHTSYSQDCQTDVKYVLSAIGVRVSDIHQAATS